MSQSLHPMLNTAIKAARSGVVKDKLSQETALAVGNTGKDFEAFIAAEQAAEKAALKERQQKERDQVRQKFRPYPDLEQWQRQQKQPELAEQWRHRAGLTSVLDVEQALTASEQRAAVGQVQQQIQWAFESFQKNL